MFRFVGVGEQAGTGIPKILHGWQSQHWSPPKLYDSAEPYNQTLIELRMTDLFPAPVMAGLKARFGERFDGLAYVERVALALAASEGTVNHARLRGVTTEHPVDLSRILQHLTQAGMLESTGGAGLFTTCDAALAWLESVGRRLRNGANAGAGAPAVAAAQRSE